MESRQKKPNKKLKYQRELRGWSQKKVAMLIGTSKDMVSRWETEERETSILYQEKLYEVFGASALELGFLRYADHHDALSLESPQIQEALSHVSTAVAQGITVAARELEKTYMDSARRTFFQLFGSSLVLAGFGGDVQAFTNMMLNNDQTNLFASELSTRWHVYNSSDTARSLQGLDLWLHEVEVMTRNVKTVRAYALLSLGYQLQGCLFRDHMQYTQAHTSFQKAFIAADEVDHLELKAASFARRGVTCIQQQKPLEALQYLEYAGTLIQDMHVPCLKGYIYQALSEAHATAQHKEEAWKQIHLAEQSLLNKNEIEEQSYCQLSTTSVTAQKGVNAVLLKDYMRALSLLDDGLAQYNPMMKRGWARLLAQKAEAYCGLGRIEESTQTAINALTIAQSIQAQKTIARIKELQHTVEQSPYRKEKGVTQLRVMLTTNE